MSYRETGESSTHAPQLIDRIVREAGCPVIALIHAPDPNDSRSIRRAAGHQQVVQRGQPEERRSRLDSRGVSTV